MYLLRVFLFLIGSCLAGLFGRYLGLWGSAILSTGCLFLIITILLLVARILFLIITNFIELYSSTPANFTCFNIVKKMKIIWFTILTILYAGLGDVVGILREKLVERYFFYEGELEKLSESIENLINSTELGMDNSTPAYHTLLCIVIRVKIVWLHIITTIYAKLANVTADIHKKLIEFYCLYEIKKLEESHSQSAEDLEDEDEKEYFTDNLGHIEGMKEYNRIKILKKSVEYSIRKKKARFYGLALLAMSCLILAFFVSFYYYF